MNLVAGDTLWTKINKIPTQYPYLDRNEKCDVIIVGGGITGALCAYHFAQAGVKTILLEKNIIGYESTSGSTSILQYEIDLDLLGLSGIIGEENAVHCFKLANQAVQDVGSLVKELDDDCSYVSRDCLYYTNKKNNSDKMLKEYRNRKDHGFNVEFIDYSNNNFSFPIEAGIYSKGLAGEIDPYKFAHALLNKSKGKNLKIFENTEALNIKSVNNQICITTNNNFLIKAKKIVVASGFKARDYFTRKKVILTRTFSIATKPVDNFKGWLNRCIIRDDNNPYTYLRTTKDNRILIGGEDISLGGQRSKVSNISENESISNEKYNILNGRLLNMFPEIKIQPEYMFSGVFGESKDGLPYIGAHSNYPNYYFCLGYGSNGILYALMGAQLLTKLFKGEYTKELDLFKVER